MKRLGSIVFISVVALAGCDNASRLDKTGQARPERDKPGAGPVKADHSGSVEDRLARLEDSYAKYGETLEWVNGIHQQQAQQAKAQQEQQQRNEPDPDAVFAVDIDPDLKLGQFEGSPKAPVTIVEAWDFA
jgi:hypothetical protein